MLSIRPLPVTPRAAFVAGPPPLWCVSAWPSPGDDAPEVEAAVARRLGIRPKTFLYGLAHYATKDQCARVCSGMAAEMPGFEFWPQRRD